jgi:hypothetical protein
MPTPLDRAAATGLAPILGRVLARIRLRHAVRAAGAGLVGAAVGILLVDLVRTSALRTTAIAMSVGAACAAASYLWVRNGRTPAAAARAVEYNDPGMRNLVITAQELIAFPDRTRPYMRARVLAEAARRAGALDSARVVPLGRDAAAALVALVILAAVLGVRTTTVADPGRGRPQDRPRETAALAGEFTIDVAAPSYTGRPRAHFRNPASLDAWAGSQAVIRVPRSATSLVRLNGAELPVREGVAQAVLSESGYLAIDAGGIHRLLPLTVTPDRAPDVRITAPAKDMRLATTAVSIPIAAEAADDLALGSLELRYTIVSGIGEQFSFTEGKMPATLARASDQSWRIEATLSPARLKLEPGDALIYRAVAADRRPGEAGVASSDTFFVEIAGPGDVALAGVEMPPDKERYALSEAMIVLKIERLQAREKSLARPALADASGNIAAEQRAVRANFIFLLGGEIQDEDVEAETSSEIAEGRFANKARQEIVAATVLMGRVERALTAMSTREALPLAREAVRALQRAFGHSRYLLRALPARARIDPARRLSGDVASASDWNRALAPAAPDPQTEAARSAMRDLIDVARDLDRASARADAVTRLSQLAERLLAMAAAAGDLQPAAREVLAARDALIAGQTPAARAALQRAAGPLVARAQRGRIDASPVARDAARLAGVAAVIPGPRSSGGAEPERRRPGGGGR